MDEKKKIDRPLLNPVHYLELEGLPPLYAQKQGDTLWIHVEGQTLCFSATSLKTFRKKVMEAGEEEEGSLLGDMDPSLVAPLPGKITKIFVKEGDDVEKEQSLLLLEAMKMQYNLKAHGKGKVKKLCIKEGQQVELGEKLILLESKKVNKNEKKAKSKI